MKRYIENIKTERLKDKRIHLYEGLSMAFLENEYSEDGYTDDDRLYLIIKLLHSFKDITYDGFIHEEDFNLINHFLTDIYHAKSKR